MSYYVWAMKRPHERINRKDKISLQTVNSKDPTLQWNSGKHRSSLDLGLNPLANEAQI